MNEQEDIFAPPEPSDDLFGRPEAPRVELPPPQSMPPTLSLDAPVIPAAAEPIGSTMTYSAPEPPAPTGDATLPAWMSSPASPAPSAEAPTEEAAGLAHGDALAPVIRKPRDSGGWFIGLIFIPLVSYSVLVTILAGYLFYRLSQDATPTPPPSPLEKLPSFDPNDEQHSTHIKIAPNKLNRASGIDAKAPLSPNQIIRLGQKLRLGDLEIEPLAVDREVVSVMAPPPSTSAEPCAYPSLVLTLKLRNVSDDVAFQPMDTLFDRYWDAKGDPPLTILELLGKDPPDFFYGGPAEYRGKEKGGSDWVVRPDKDPDLTNRDDEVVLNPGDEKEFFVCTDGGKTTKDKKARDTAEAIDNHHGKLLWRVHLRRGLEVVNANRYVPISTVIGVEFSDEDYRKSS